MRGREGGYIHYNTGDPSPAGGPAGEGGGGRHVIAVGGKRW